MLIAGAAFFSAAPLVAEGFPASNANLIVTLVNQEPDPVEPGKYVDLRFKFENEGSENAEDVMSEILPSYPFLLEPGDNAVVSLGSIHGIQKDDSGVIVKYRLKVDEKAVEGDNKIKLRYKHLNSGWVELPEFTIRVRPAEAMVSIVSINSNPGQVRPGGTTTVKISLKNLENIAVKNVKIKMELGGLSFAPVGSSTEKVIETIAPKQTADIQFELMADAGASSGLNRIPLKISYKDQLNHNYSINSDIGLLVGAEPDLYAGLDSTTVFQSGMAGEVVVKFVNKGVSKIKLLSVKLKEAEGITMLSPEMVYVGNIDSDDYETAEFKIYAAKTDKSEIALPFSVTYKDSSNKDYSQDLQLKLKLYSTQDAKMLGLSKGNGKVGIVIIVLIVVIGLTGYFVLKKRKKKA